MEPSIRCWLNAEFREASPSTDFRFRWELLGDPYGCMTSEPQLQPYTVPPFGAAASRRASLSCREVSFPAGSRIRRAGIRWHSARNVCAWGRLDREAGRLLGRPGGEAARSLRRCAMSSKSASRRATGGIWGSTSAVAKSTGNASRRRLQAQPNRIWPKADPAPAAGLPSAVQRDGMMLLPLPGSLEATSRRPYRGGMLKALASLASDCSRSIGTVFTFTGIRSSTRPAATCGPNARPPEPGAPTAALSPPGTVAPAPRSCASPNRLARPSSDDPSSRSRARYGLVC